MITKDNLKKVLSFLGFEKETVGEYYSKIYSTCSIHVDFDNETLIYPEDKGLVVNDRTTSNFSHNENFVVFECVCRLLDKGYRPEHIELEPRWTLGHDAKGGKADILVKDEDKNPLIIVECKTAGAEFNKEKKKTEEDGGQLFSYWQQEGATRWLTLYSSDFKDNEICYKCLSVNCSDDANIAKIAEKDNDLHIYANAYNDKDRFEVWSNTYGQQWLDDVIFSPESQAYNIGIPPLRKGQLRDFSPEDKIVNRFEEILRHNNVSDKENAFNRLVALFICKLVDEIKKLDLDEVDFQYKQGTDTYESLQDRLQKLHQQGMEEFMKEKIFYVEADYAERLFEQYTGRKRKAAIEDLNRTIRILKFYSNNDFAFKDVHNEELFFQNGKILVEVVQLFQPYRIVYPSKHQFLGDLFEQLLNKGFKQNEGQFFTPTPITRFIWDALPLQQYISKRDLPRIIDYACGAGHFLTEAVEAINAVRQDGNNSWVEKHIYGIEKDYRLARVSKISMFMNGAGGANIIFGDGLENYAEKGITSGSFDILVANPPYSVSGFKQHLKLKNNTFNIIDKITLDGSEIETLFVERIAQLLKPQGIAAVILPASILSNSSNSYIAAREQLLQNFMLRAIVNFGSKTFGATGTNTVVLFLERYNEPPQVSKMAEDVVDGILSNTDCSDWQDKDVMEEYLAHQGIDDDTYKQFLSKSIPWELLQADSYLKSYTEAVEKMAISYPKSATDEKKKEILLNKFFEYAFTIERDKLYYFTLVHSQKTLVISAPTDNKDQKVFLGYDWSNRKGAEGIIINKKGGQLYDDENRFASNTLASCIRFAYYGDVDVELPEEIQKYAKTYWLKDMMDFSQSKKDKIVRTTVLDKFKIKSKYPLVVLGDIVIINPPKSEIRDVSNDTLVSFVEMSSVSNEGFITKKVDRKIGELRSGGYTYFAENDIIIAKITPCMENGKCAIAIGLSNKIGMGSSEFHVFRCSNKIINSYLFALLNMNTIRKAAEMNMTGASGHRRVPEAFYKELQIPLPPIDIQKKIVKECRKVDDEYNNSRMTIDTYRQKIKDIFIKLEVVKNSGGVIRRISEIFKLSSGKMLSNKDRIEGNIPIYGGNGITGYHNKGFVSQPTIVIGRVGEYCGSVHLTVANCWVTDNALYATQYLTDVDKKFLLYALRQANLNQYANRTGQPNISQSSIANVEIPFPNITKQREIIKEVEKYELIIEEAKRVMQSCSTRKQVILDKYLK